jgi:hypothetical protein
MAATLTLPVETGGEADFFAALPVINAFDRLLDDDLYQPLPPGWLVGLTDVEASSAAIRAGRYKAVNMAGVAGIAAIRNALAGRELPFVFGGDGASFAVPAADGPVARRALATTAAWARAELKLSLRAALIPLSAIRAAGRDVRVARFAASSEVSYAMFTGGGLAWAEAQLKAGAFAVPPTDPEERPDLTGLSCRWEAIRAANGLTLSLIVVGGGDPERLRAALRELLALAGGASAAPPVAAGRLRVRWPPSGLDLEVRASRRPGQSLWRRRLELGLATLLAYLVFKTGRRVGGFDPARYRHDVAANADFRKYDDGLRMTLDCTPAQADRIEELLRGHERAGTLRYGLHRQDAALMTCFVPSIHDRGHAHFIDGAGGGYTAAAARLKLARG